MFSRILYSNSTIIDRSSSDSQVLQRYKSQVVQCLDHRDPSIRRRALDVVAALVDETNVETLIPEIMNYLKLAERDFRTELVAKVFASVQRFAPSVIWNFNTVLRLLRDSGNYVGNEVITTFCKLIGEHPDIRPHAMAELYNAIKTETDTQPLIQVAAWALGEFQETPSDLPLVITKLLSMPQTTVDAKCYLLMALAKLAVRFGGEEATRATLSELANNNHLEVQQRAGELLRVLDKAGLRDEILAPVEFNEAHDPESVGEGQQLPKAAAKTPETTDTLIGLIDIDSNVGPSPPQAPVSVLTAAAPPAAAPPAAPVEPQAPPGALEALRTSDYVIWFELQRNASNPKQLAIRATIFGLGDIALTQFVVQYGVPQGWVISVQPPTGNVLEPKGGRPIQQVMMLENRGVNALVMLTQTSYMYRTQPLKETGKINPIFN
jgi:hypothetical protein